MKITVYTISDCAFCKQEKDYLISHNVAYEEKNLEINKDFLTEMLAVSNNFAGTPVTKIEKDDGQITVLKGFTKEDFDQALNIVQPAPAVQTAEASMNMPSDTAVTPPIPAPVPLAPEPMAPAPMPEPPQPPIIQPVVIEDQNKIQAELNQTAEAVLKTEPPVTEQSVIPAVQTAEASMTMPPAPEPTAPVAPAIVSPAPTVDNEKLNGILQNLQNNATASTPAPTTPTTFPAQNAAGGMPQIPEPDFH